MSDGFTMLDFFTMPPLPRQIMRVILRHAPITCEGVAQYLACDHQTVQDGLDYLTHATWLLADEQTPTHYGVHFGKSHSRRNYGVWKLAALDLIDETMQRWQPHINTPSGDTGDGLLRRGGKRRLPGSIWDKLN